RRGPFDVPLLLQDRTFKKDGSLQYDTNGHQGFQGSVMLVNGVPWPRIDVSTRKYRFRLLNGSNARPFQLALSNGDHFTLIATDRGLLPDPVFVRTLPLSMSERAEVIIAVTLWDKSVSDERPGKIAARPTHAVRRGQARGR